MGSHENEMVNKSRHFISVSLRVQGAIYAAFFMALYGTRLNKGFLYIFAHLKFYVDWFTLTALNFVLIWFVITATDWIDKRFSWKENPNHRFWIQVWFICLFPYFACEFFNISYGYYVGRDLFRSPYGTFEVATCLIFLIILNLAYPFAKYVMAGQKEEVEEIENGAASSSQEEVLGATIGIVDLPDTLEETMVTDIVVFGGRDGKTKMLEPDEIAAIIQQYGVNTIYTFSQETFTCLGTLKGIYAPLDKEKFFKANKNAVAHRKAIGTVEPRDDGGLNIDIHPYYDQPIGVSHHERKAFTTWYTKPINSLGKLIMLPL